MFHENFSTDSVQDTLSSSSTDTRSTGTRSTDTRSSLLGNRPSPPCLPPRKPLSAGSLEGSSNLDDPTAGSRPPRSPETVLPPLDFSKTSPILKQSTSPLARTLSRKPVGGRPLPGNSPTGSPTKGAPPRSSNELQQVMNEPRRIPLPRSDSPTRRTPSPQFASIVNPSNRPLSMQSLASALPDDESREQSEAQESFQSKYWKYHMLKYSKDMYLTTNPGEQQLDMPVGPSYYVDVDVGGVDDRHDFMLTFYMGGNISMTVSRNKDATRSYQAFVFLDSNMKSDKPSPLAYAATDCSQMIQTSDHLKSVVKCEQFSIRDDGGNEWIIGNRAQTRKGSIVTVSRSKVYFSLKSDPQVILGMVRRRTPKKVQVLQLGVKSPDHEDDDDPDEEKIGWLYVFDRPELTVLPWMWNLVIGLTTAVAYGQRLDRKKSLRNSLNFALSR